MTLNKQDSILSIDFGERYFGFAIKLKNEDTTFALDVLDTKKTDYNEKLLEYISKYKPDTLVIGYPIGLSGNKSRMSDKVDKFAKEIHQKYEINVVKIDERFSSKINTRDGLDRSDSIAALNILDTYINNG